MPYPALPFLALPACPALPCPALPCLAFQLALNFGVGNYIAEELRPQWAFLWVDKNK